MLEGWAETSPSGATNQFRIASNTKTMPGTVILQLVQEKKLRLDDPVSAHHYGVPNGENITVEQLLIAQAVDATPNVFGPPTRCSPSRSRKDPRSRRGRATSTPTRTACGWG